MKRQLRLNANHVELIAIIAMTIDHVSDLIYPGFPAEPGAMALHIVGRLTAPIMWFFVCEGYYYTRNVKRYMLRMGMFAVISHFAYCLSCAKAVQWRKRGCKMDEVVFLSILSHPLDCYWSASRLYLWRCQLIVLAKDKTV